MCWYIHFLTSYSYILIGTHWLLYALPIRTAAIHMSSINLNFHNTKKKTVILHYTNSIIYIYTYSERVISAMLCYNADSVLCNLLYTYMLYGLASCPQRNASAQWAFTRMLWIWQWTQQQHTIFQPIFALSSCMHNTKLYILMLLINGICW